MRKRDGKKGDEERVRQEEKYRASAPGKEKGNTHT